MALFSRKKPRVIGIDISSTSIKLLELSQNGQNYRVEAYATEPLPPNTVVEKNITDVEVVGEAVGRAVKRSGTKTRSAAVAVAGNSVITKIIQMPEEMSDDDRAGQIEVEADQYIPFPLEEISMDFEVLGPSETDEGMVDVIIAASRNENVEARVGALEAAGLTAEVVDIESFALENTINMMTGSSQEVDETVAIVDIGATMTTLTVLRNNSIIYTREQAFGGRQLTEDIQRRYGLSFEEAALAKRQGGDALPDNYVPEVLEPFKESIGQQVSRALQFFYAASQYGAVGSIIFAGGCASIPGTAEIIEEKTGTATRVANPFENMSIASGIKADALTNDAPAMLIACGLALRSFA